MTPNPLSGATAADRATAAEVMRGQVDYFEVIDAIAAALAAEREKAQAPFLALAEAWARRRFVNADRARDLRDCAEAIRRIAEDEL